MQQRKQAAIGESELKLDESFVTAFENRPSQSEEELYKLVAESDQQAALFVLRQAQDEFPDDLDAREKAIKIGLSMAYLDRSQLTLDGIARRLFGSDELKPEDVTKT
jgi:hypothetical protein